MTLQPSLITYESAVAHLSWAEAVAALRIGHTCSRAQVEDVFLGPPTATLLSRGAYVCELGYGLKAVTVLDGNAARGLPTVQGAMLVFEAEHGRLEAVIEGRLVTDFKTAADSVLGATFLARKDSTHLLVVGAGTVARSLVPAYVELFPGLRRVSVWARRTEQALSLAHELQAGSVAVEAVEDLAEAVAVADIVSCATMAREPVLRGAWVRPGTHVDLIGAYKGDMREADDDLISSASLFVDSRKTTIQHVGELKIPIASGVIGAGAVKGDLYELVQGSVLGRRSAHEVTASRTVAVRTWT